MTYNAYSPRFDYSARNIQWYWLDNIDMPGLHWSVDTYLANIILIKI